MSENVFWVYNGWAILITVLGPIYSIIDAEIRSRTFILRTLFPFFMLASLILLFVLSNWITALLFIPCWVVGLIVGSIIKHRGLG